MLQLFIFYILLLAIQGVMSAVFTTVPTPDLFLIAALGVLWHFRPWNAVVFAFGIGLIQDLVGYGSLGFHALGLAAAVLVASIVVTQIRQSGFIERLIIVLVALVAKWTVFFCIVSLFHNRNPLVEILQIAPLEAVFTVVLSLIILPIIDGLMKRNGILRREFL